MEGTRESSERGYQERPDEISLVEEVHQQVSGNFKSWAKDMNEYFLRHDRSINVDQKLSYEEIEKSCSTRYLDVDVGSALHMVMGAFQEGESKMLTDTVEVNKPKNLEMQKSGLQLWRLLKNNFDRASAFSVTSNLECIRNMQEANNVQDVMSTPNLFERRHQVYDRQTVASNESEFVKMETLNISVHPEESQMAHLVKVIPDSIVKELKRSTNIDIDIDKRLVF